ncbi:hypothetical protein [Streptococcus suis]|uniref:Uncharacterized protein n=1 Tax=Streptococcus suis TaxID=1307 RepID=A0A0Z8DZP8_STRSU|nr:hypothetical protein [Streptococcus suis]MBS8066945.1 hypothetical protein [Streptococcus suis]MBS8082509.1 hypothetical protein [Streptococcus suis]MBS8084207.1 hypothetical protein [Streptococcus suis]MBS8111866.1 hypothetical protein [Streptococcus suis]MCH1674270.1 hypothetical protein [Streptococcus suis]
MTKKKIERISVIHREKILWLKWYFMRDKEQPKYSVLERKMFDAAKNQDMLAYQKYATIKQITDIRVQTSPEDMLETIKEVYVYNHINIIGAAQRILYLSQSVAYTKLNKWFETYSDLYFSIVPLPDMGVYHNKLEEV